MASLALLTASLLNAHAFVAPSSGLKCQSPRLSSTSKVTMFKPMESLQKLPAAATALSISLYAQAASAKSVQGVNGALDFGPLAGDQPGGEGTGKALGINDDILLYSLLGVVVIIGLLFAQWQGYQDDDDDFFDTYDSRRSDREITNRNRV